MDISNVKQNYVLQNTAMPKDNISANRTDSATNTVNISNEGQEALMKDVPSVLDDLKYYQVAPWIADYMVALPTELGGKGGVEFGSKVVGQSDYEKNQYAGLAQKEYRAVLEEESFSSEEEYYNALITDKDYSAKLHERFLERMTKINEQLYSKLG